MCYAAKIWQGDYSNTLKNAKYHIDGIIQADTRLDFVYQRFLKVDTRLD